MQQLHKFAITAEWSWVALALLPHATACMPSCQMACRECLGHFAKRHVHLQPRPATFTACSPRWASVSLTHSLTHPFNQSSISFIYWPGDQLGPTDKVCVGSMPKCILWHNHMRRLLFATCMCSIATLIKQLVNHSSF